MERVRARDFREDNPNSLFGREIFYVQPVILGGSPDDPKNKVALSREQHIQAVRYWNKVIFALKARRSKEQNA